MGDDPASELDTRADEDPFPVIGTSYEELEASNQELKDKVEELTRSNSDLQNLMASTEVAALFLDRDLRLSRYTPHAAELFDVAPSDVGRPFSRLSHTVDHDDLMGVARGVLGTHQPVSETIGGHGGGAFLLRARPYRTSDGRVDGVVLSFVDVTELEAAKRAAGRRAEQQSVVADLGEHALEGVSLEALFDEAVRRVRDVLSADACKVLRYEPADRRLRLVAGVGWAEGLIGEATVPDAAESQAGYTLLAHGTVLSPNLDEETRFTAPDLLTSHGLTSGMSVVITSPEGDHPFGVLGVHSVPPRAYSEEDGAFLQSVANVLADAAEQERKAETIRQHLQEIEAVYDTAPIGLAYLDRDLRHRRVNRRLAEINGRPVEAHIGKTVREIDPALAEFVEPLHRHVLETGEPLLDHEATGPDPRDPSQIRTWLTRYVPQQGADGEVEGINIVVRDITERKRQELRLAETAGRLQTALEGGRLGVWSTSLETGETTFDERAAAIFGSDASPDALREGIADEDRDEVSALWAAAADPDGDGLFEATYRYRVGGGSSRWVSSRARTRFEGEAAARRAVQIDGVAVDVSALKAAEEQVRRQLGEVESYFDAIPTAVLVLDAEGRYVRVNERLTEITGVAAGDLIGKRPADVFPGFADTNQIHVDRVLETGEAVTGVEMHLGAPATPDDEQHWLVSFHPIADEDAVVGVSIVIHDVTPLKRAQAELEALAAELEDRVVQRTAEVRRLAADLTEAEQRERRRVAQVLHDDLQQILYALQVKLQLLSRALAAEGGTSPADLLAQANTLLDSAVHSTRTLTVDLSPPVLRGEGLDRTIEWLAHRMEEAYGLAVTVETDEHVEVGSNVHVLLFQIVRELLFNVVKHAGTGEARVRVWTDDSDIRIEVEDDGAGFSPAADELADGFGLFSVRERLQLAGGQVDVSSELGAGTRVGIVCPAAV